MDAGGEKLVDPGRFLEDLKQPGLVSAIDLARWLAAFIVAIGHARFPLLKGYGLLEADQKPLWVQGWYFVTGYFVEAVLIFFVLSGFLVGGMVCGRIKSGTFDPPGYGVDRFSRLYLAFLPALLITVLLTWVGMTWFNGTGLYDGTNATFVEKDTVLNMAANTGWDVFLGNLFMLQYYFVPEYGANPPLWTLSSEFWFYVVFGLAGAAAIRSGAPRLWLGGLAVLGTLLLGPMFWANFGMWLIGVIAAVIRPPRWPLLWPALALFAGMLLFRRYADAALEPTTALRYAIQYGICIAMALILLGLRGRRLALMERMAGFNRFMADFSYSLYLTHYPIVILFVAALGVWTGDPGFISGFAPTDPKALATYGATLVLILVFAWIFSQFTERKTHLLRGWMKRNLLGKGKA